MKNARRYKLSQQKSKECNKLDKNESRVAYEIKILMKRYGWSYASQDKIAKLSGMSRGTVNKIIAKLHILEYIYKVYRGVKSTCLYYPKWPQLKRSFFSSYNCQSELSYTTKEINSLSHSSITRESGEQPVVTDGGMMPKTSSRVTEWYNAVCQPENSFEMHILYALAAKSDCGYCQIAYELGQMPYRFCDCGIMGHAARYIIQHA